MTAARGFFNLRVFVIEVMNIQPHGAQYTKPMNVPRRFCTQRLFHWNCQLRFPIISESGRRSQIALKLYFASGRLGLTISSIK